MVLVTGPSPFTEPTSYHIGDTVTLTAVPGTGEVTWQLEWCWHERYEHSAQAGGDLRRFRDKTVTANFDFIEYTLTVTLGTAALAGNVGTPVTSVRRLGPSYHYGDVVALTASPGTGETFRWMESMSFTGSTIRATITNERP